MGIKKMEFVNAILNFWKEIVMKYGTKSLVASLAMYFCYLLATTVPSSPAIITSIISITVIAISFFYFKHLQEKQPPIQTISQWIPPIDNNLVEEVLERYEEELTNPQNKEK